MKALWLSFAIVVADQITKLIVKGFGIPALGLSVEGMYLGQSIPIVGDFIRLTFVENPGMAFGIDLGGKLFFSIFTLIASFGILFYFMKVREEGALFRYSLAMILGGAFGNLIDRTFYGVIFGEAPLFFGKVVDFMDVDFFNLDIFGYHLTRWPVFNVADASVSIGVVLLLFAHRKSEKIHSSTEQVIADQMHTPTTSDTAESNPTVSENS